MSTRPRMVYERGKLVPLDRSERARQAESEKRFLQGAAAGGFVVGAIVTVAFTLGVAFAGFLSILIVAVILACWGYPGKTPEGNGPWSVG